MPTCEGSSSPSSWSLATSQPTSGVSWLIPLSLSELCVSDFRRAGSCEFFCDCFDTRIVLVVMFVCGVNVLPYDELCSVLVSVVSP